MTASPQRRRHGTIAAALSGVLVLGAAPTLGYVGWHVLRNSKAGTAAKTLPVVAFPSTPTAMFAVVDDQQLVTALAVLVLAPGTGKGGTLVSFPTDASTAQTAEEQQVPFADSVINEGAGAVSDDVESLSRVSIGTSGVLDQQAVATLLAPLTAISVALPADVVDVAADGTKTTLFAAGQQPLSPEQAASALVADDPSQAETTRLPNVRAIWTAIAAAVGTGVSPDTVTALGPDGPTDFNDFMAHFLAGPIQVFNELATVPITGQTNPNNVDVGRLDIPSVVLLMAGLAPSAMITPKPTLNFRIENGLTQADVDAAGLVGVTPVQVTLDLVARLLFTEGNVVSVSPEVFTLDTKQVPDATTIFAEGGVQSNELEVISNKLGTVDVKDPTFRFPMVQVVIVIGKSYLSDMKDRQVTPDATTTLASDTVGTTGPDTVADPSASTVTS